MNRPTDSHRPRVLVLCGGQSGEHGISCATAAGVLANIDRDRFDVVLAGITPAGRWVSLPDDPAPLRMGPDGPAKLVESDRSVALRPGSGELVTLDRDGHAASSCRIDVVFPLLHGPYGEDGTVQGLLEMAHLPYVGCGVAASAVCMDKPLTKALLAQAGLDVGRWQGVSDAEWRFERAGVLRRLGDLGLPVFVKPARAGSSLGITRVSDARQLADAIEAAREVDPSVIVEAASAGLEVECAVLQSASSCQPRTTAPGRIAMAERVQFYDYRTKYLDHAAVSLEIPARIPEHLAARVREVAARAFRVLGCEGLARVDTFVDVDADVVRINEVNTMPGFTPYSMYPKLWEHQGVEYRELISQLIDLALARPVGLR